VKGFPGYSVYAASKAACTIRTRVAQRTEGQEYPGERAAPGPIATPMQDQVLTEEAKQMFESLIPRGKMGRPEEIAAAALFLASDDSSFVNGWSCPSTAASRPSEFAPSENGEIR
jgi:Dehydrogenases with different specificities (related to short-chain alcohol dehydrogenases)